MKRTKALVVGVALVGVAGLLVSQSFPDNAALRSNDDAKSESATVATERGSSETKDEAERERERELEREREREGGAEREGGLTPGTPEFAEEMAREAEEAKRFDEADLAQEFYVNSRTGPLLTRGANPTRGIPQPLDPSLYRPALEKMQAMAKYSAAGHKVLPANTPTAGALLNSWSNLGPSNQGGRSRSLLIHPTTPTTMYAGGVSGGVWKTTDGGGSWVNVSDGQIANLAVVSLAFDPANPAVIYAGTGEGFFNGDAIRGAGVFKTADSGATWTFLAGTTGSNFSYTNSVAVSPRDSQRIYAATRTGLWRSTDGGTSFTQVVNASGVNGCTQVVIQQTGATGYAFAACGTFAQGTVYRALDDGTSAFASVLAPAGMGRSSLAIAPSNESVLYVMGSRTGSGGTGAHGLWGVYRSDDAGATFTLKTDGSVNMSTATQQQKINALLLSNPVYGAGCFGSPQFLNQGWYDNVIAVDPLDPDIVWAGGVDLWRSDNQGAYWGTAGYWWATKGTQAQYHHADQHGIVFHPGYNGTTNKIMFSASDGGIERNDDARAAVNTTLAQICGSGGLTGPTWIDRNSGFVTTQFYDGAVYPDGQTYFGGLQDNGTQRGASGNLNWSSLQGGDGGYAAVDTLGDANSANDVLFAEFTGISIRKSTDGGANFVSATSGISDPFFAFIAPFTMNQADKQQLWTGGAYIWRTTNQATGSNTWVRASALTCGNGSVSAIATHPLDGNRVLVGMSDGCNHRNTAALTATSATVWPTGTALGGFISWLAWDPTDLNVAYATVSRFGGTNVFKTTDAGATWVARIGSGANTIPQIPALSVVVNPANPQEVFVGTDLGVFTSDDGGANWYVENSGFVGVPVESLKINETAPSELFAFTHGRGAWRVPLVTNGTPPTTTTTSTTSTTTTTSTTVPPTTTTSTTTTTAPPTTTTSTTSTTSTTTTTAAPTTTTTTSTTTTAPPTTTTTSTTTTTAPPTTTTTTSTTTTAPPTTTTTTSIPSGGGSGERLYQPTVIPPSAVAIGNAYPVETAQRVNVFCQGTINGLWWYRTAQDTGVNTASVWRNGTLIAEGNANPGTTGWSYIAFSPPIPINAGASGGRVSSSNGDKLVVGIHHPNGAYGVRLNGFTNRSVSSPSGCMISPSSSSTAKNGMYRYSGTPALPSLSYVDSEYFVTPDFVLGTPPITTTTIGVTTTSSGVTTTTSGVTTTTISGGSGDRLYQPNQAPTSGVAIGSAYPIETAQRVNIFCTGKITGLWWYRTAQDTGINTATLWRNGTKLAQAAANPATTGWSFIPFSSAVNVSSGDQVVVGIHHPNGAYAVTVNGFNARSVTSLSGCMTAPGSQPSSQNGFYAYSASPVLPTLSYDASEYWITPNLVLP